MSLHCQDYNSLTRFEKAQTAEGPLRGGLAWLSSHLLPGVTMLAIGTARAGEVGVRVKEAGLNPFGDVAEQLEKSDMVFGLARGFQVDDLRHLGADGDIKAERGLRTALERVVGERVGGQLQILRNLFR